MLHQITPRNTRHPRQEEQTTTHNTFLRHLYFHLDIQKTHLVALDDPLSELLLDVASANSGVDDCRRLRQDVLGIERRVQISFRELQLELVVADGKIPVEEEHPLDPASPARAQSLPLLLVPGCINTQVQVLQIPQYGGSMKPRASPTRPPVVKSVLILTVNQRTL